MRDRVDGHVPLLHALEQTGLRLGRRSVDLVDQHQVGEHGPGTELELRLSLIEDVRPDDVGREQVRRALDARVGGIDRTRQRAHERGLAHARMVLNEHVPLGQQRDEHVSQRALGHLDRERHVLADPRAQRRHVRGIELAGPVHLGRILRPLRCHRDGPRYALSGSTPR